MLPISGIPLSLNEFAEQFGTVFNHPAQMQHFKEMLAGLLVSNNRTVAGIHQGLIDGDGYDALRKFLSRSPWTAEQLRSERLTWIRHNLPASTEAPRVVAIDPTFVHHTGENIYGVYWYWDYAKRCYTPAQRLVMSTWVSPTKQVPLGARLYHRGFLDEQQLYLDEVKPAADASDAEWDEYNDLVNTYENNKADHVKQWQLAGELVDEVEGLGIPKDAYVLDAALLSPDLAEKIDNHGQAYVSRLAKTRLVELPGRRLASLLTFAKELPREVFKPIHVQTRHGEPRIYACFTKYLKIHGWRKVRVVISYDNENLDGEPIFIVTNKENWTQPNKVVQLYMYRDPIEHFIRDQKQEVGLEDCQQRGQQAVEKHWELSLTAHTFLELAYVPKVAMQAPSQKLETFGQKRRLMELEVLQDFVARVLELVFDGWDTKEFLDLICEKRLNGLAS